MNNSENDPHTQGTQLLQLAQELEQNGEYKEAISKMKQARDILVDANFWGEEEVAVIEEELNRLAGLASSEEGSDPQSQGMELLQSAQESEKNGKYREAIDQMRSARDILVGAGFWGQEESQTIDSEIDRLKGLLGSKYTSNAQLKGTNLLEQAQQAEESGDHESAIEKMEEARDILVDAKIWGSDESKAIEEEVSRLKAELLEKKKLTSSQDEFPTPKPLASGEDPQTVGVKFLQDAQQAEQDENYDLAIEKMKKARDILVDAGIWGEDEKLAIEEEIDRIKALAEGSDLLGVSPEPVVDPKTKGINLLQTAQEQSSSGEYAKAKKNMEKGRDILVEADIWGEEEVQAINEEILHLQTLLEQQNKGAQEPATATSTASEVNKAPVPLETPQKPSEDVIEGSDMQTKGMELLGLAQSQKENEEYELAIKNMKEARDTLVRAGLWGEEESGTIDEEVSLLQTLLEQQNQGPQEPATAASTPSETIEAPETLETPQSPSKDVIEEPDAQTKGMELLGLAQSQKEKEEYELAIKNMKEARDTLVRAGLWGEEESGTIDEEVSRLQTLLEQQNQGPQEPATAASAPSEVIEAPETLETPQSPSKDVIEEPDAQTKGMELLGLAQSQKENEEYELAIKNMKEARETLVRAGLWGEEESGTIDEEIQAMEGLRSGSETSFTVEIEEQEELEKMEEQKKLKAESEESSEADLEKEEIPELDLEIEEEKTKEPLSKQKQGIEEASESSGKQTTTLPPPSPFPSPSQSTKPSKHAGTNISSSPGVKPPSLKSQKKPSLQKIKIPPLKSKKLAKEKPEVKVEPPQEDVKAPREEAEIPQEKLKEISDLEEELPVEAISEIHYDIPSWLKGINIPELKRDSEDPFEKAKDLIQSGQAYESDDEFLKAALCLHIATEILVNAGIWGDEQRAKAKEQIDGLREDAEDIEFETEQTAQDKESEISELESSKEEDQEIELPVKQKVEIESESNDSEPSGGLEFTAPDDIPMDEDALAFGDALSSPVEEIEVKEPKEIEKDEKGELSQTAPVSETSESSVGQESPSLEDVQVPQALEQTTKSEVSPEKPTPSKIGDVSGKKKKASLLFGGKTEASLGGLIDKTKEVQQEKGFSEVQSHSLLNLTKKTKKGKTSGLKSGGANKSETPYNFLNFTGSGKKNVQKSLESKELEKKPDLSFSSFDKKEKLIQNLQERRKKREKNGRKSLKICPMCGKIASKCTCGFLNMNK